jgi:hypothetical protein
VTFKIPYIYDFITELFRQQAEIVQNHSNPNVRNIGQAEAQRKNIRGLNLLEFKLVTVQVTELPFILR